MHLLGSRFARMGGEPRGGAATPARRREEGAAGSGDDARRVHEGVDANGGGRGRRSLEEHVLAKKTIGQRILSGCLSRRGAGEDREREHEHEADGGREQPVVSGREGA